jgi:hypothetical protein
MIRSRFAPQIAAASLSASVLVGSTMFVRSSLELPIMKFKNIRLSNAKMTGAMVQ